MPPRKATPAVAAPVPDFEGDDPFEPGAVVTNSYENPYAQEPRTIRANHTLKTTNISKSGNTPIYRFADVLDFAYTQGFLGFSDPSVSFYPGMGYKGGPLCHVIAVGKFLNADGGIAYVSATGDASPESCGERVAPHYPRMAETRAQGRVLNRALNLNAVMAEELLHEDDSPTNAPVTPSVPNVRAPSAPSTGAMTKSQMSEDPNFQPKPNRPDGAGWECEICGKDVKGKSAYWSVDKTGKILCWDHQQEAMKK